MEKWSYYIHLTGLEEKKNAIVKPALFINLAFHYEQSN